MKKQILYLAFLPLLVVACLSSCQKTDDLANQTTPIVKDGPAPGNEGNDDVTTRSVEAPFDYAECPLQLGAVVKTDGRLVFQSEEHFEKCAFCLEYQYGNYNDAFDAQYPGATPAQLDGYATLTGFNEWGSYASFESGLGFSSLRAKIQTESDAFLASTLAATINLDLDPDGLSPVIRYSERALLNEGGEVMVGGKLKTKEDWTEKSIPDDCGFLLLRGTTFTVTDNPVLIGRQLKVWIWVQSGVAFSKLVGKMKYYKMDNNGNFRSNVRAEMKVRVQGNCFDNECGPTPQVWYNYDGWKNRTHLQVTATAGALRWREAFVESSDPMWLTEASSVSAQLFNNQNFFLYPLAR